MTLIEKTLKKFDTEYEGQYNDFSTFCCKGEYCMKNCGKILSEELKAFITQALQEQDRESRKEILKGIETYWNDNNYDEISSGGLIKHLGLDLKQDEN